MSMKKPPHDRSGLYNLFSRYVKDDGTIIHTGFANDLVELRKYGDEIGVIQPSDSAIDTPSPFFEFANKYAFPPSMHMFLLDYIVNNEINPEKLMSGVYIVDESNYEASGKHDASINYLGYSADSASVKYLKLTLAFPVDATHLQIREAVKEAKNFIKTRQTKANGGKVSRKRYSGNAELNNWVIEQYDNGLTPKQIVHGLPEKWQSRIHTNQDISDIINRIKNK